jgi:predicted nucleotidyltransferase
MKKNRTIKRGKTLKQREKKTFNKRTFKKKDFVSGDGMLTSVWGPSLWHYLHTLSFNYPINPTKHQKESHKRQLMLLKDTLPCRYCRENLKNNFKTLPLMDCHLKNRNTFSRYIYQLHEVVNKMLGKKSGLSYCDVRERYEHFRARCLTEDKINAKIFKPRTRKIKEKGCTESLYGKKAKCVIQIVPQEFKCQSFKFHEKCRIKR